jgi:succinoglycan biosynthesis protein ExoM
MAPSILIGIASYRRREQLLTLLASIEAQTGVEGADVRVAVIDNSPEHELKDLCFTGARFSTQLVHEPVPGISAARSRALKLAREQSADFLVFVDDDERADADWLACLIAKQREADADVVVGVVHAELREDAPAWMKRARVFDMAPPAHERAIGAGYSCNIMFRVMAADGLDFDPFFGLTGGEDTFFFAQMHLRGAKFARAYDAIVREPTPADRARLSWLMRRWTRTGISDAEIEMRLGMRSRLGAFGKGMFRTLAGGALTMAALPLSFGANFGNAAKGLRIAARGWGYVMSAMRRRIVEYKRA